MTTQEAFSSQKAHMHRNWAVLLLGWICVALGVVIAGGGIWLLMLGGSWYYAIAGLGLVATGALLIAHRSEAVWLYLAVWLGTVLWAWWEVGADWWAEVPRLAAPTLILVFVLLCIPALSRRSSTQNK